MVVLCVGAVSYERGTPAHVMRNNLRCDWPPLKAQNASVGTYKNCFRIQNFTEMCSGSDTGSYLRRLDFVYHSTLGYLRRIDFVYHSTLGKTPKTLILQNSQNPNTGWRLQNSQNPNAGWSLNLSYIYPIGIRRMVSYLRLVDCCITQL